MTAQRARLLGWLGFGLTLACIPLTVFMLSQHLRAFLPGAAIWSTVVAFIGAVAFSVVGALIVSQHPRHAIGWIFTLSGVATAGAVGLCPCSGVAPPPGLWFAAAPLAHTGFHPLIPSGLFLSPDPRLLPLPAR